MQQGKGLLVGKPTSDIELAIIADKDGEVIPAPSLMKLLNKLLKKLGKEKLLLAVNMCKNLILAAMKVKPNSK